MAQGMTSMQPESLLELLEPMTLRARGEIADQFQPDDRGIVLTDLQRAALRWISSFD